MEEEGERGADARAQGWRRGGSGAELVFGLRRENTRNREASQTEIYVVIKKISVLSAILDADGRICGIRDKIRGGEGGV